MIRYACTQSRGNEMEEWRSAREEKNTREEMKGAPTVRGADDGRDGVVREEDEGTRDMYVVCLAKKVTSGTRTINRARSNGTVGNTIHGRLNRYLGT